MDDLSPTSGLPLWLDHQHQTLVLDQPGGALRPDALPLRLVRRTLLDPGALSPEILYWTFLDVALPTDEGVFREHGVRHNLLMLRPGRVGPEYIKTWGHHQICADGVQCPEVYGVLHGRGLLLLQQQEEAPEEPVGRVRLADVRWIEALAGQKVVVPAAYGLVIVNLGVEPFVLSNLVAARAWPVHLVYDALHGAAYYVSERDGEMAAEPNRRYAEPLPPVREDTPIEAPELGVEAEVPLYSAFVHQPERFDWLLQGAPSTIGVC